MTHGPGVKERMHRSPQSCVALQASETNFRYPRFGRTFLRFRPTTFFGTNAFVGGGMTATALSLCCTAEQASPSS